MNTLKRLIDRFNSVIFYRIDITFFKLRIEKAKLDIIAENMREGAILLDASKKILFINPTAKIILGIGKNQTNREEVIGAFNKKFPSINIDKCLKQSAPGNPCKIAEIESESEIFQLIFSKLSEKDQRKYLTDAMIWIEDITEAKMLERKKSEFVSVVAHQLRTPLSGIKWTLHMLISGDFGEMTNEQKVFLMKSYENNERMISLVNDMLAADRIESGRMKYDLIRINIRDLVENVLFEVFPNAEKRRIKINFNSPPEEKFVVLVDPSKIRAVLQNLLENSIKYTMEGGAIYINISKQDSVVTVTIKDNGIGIPKEQKQQIFTRFFRAPNALKLEANGTGLGLYMVKKIVEQHGGKVWFESEENNGSTFYFSLPLARTDENYKKI